MGREPKKRPRLEYDPDAETWTASQNDVRETHSRPNVALRRLATRAGLPFDGAEWYEYANIPKDVRAEIERVRESVRLEREALELGQGKEELALRLHQEFRLSVSEVARLLDYSPAHMGKMIERIKRAKTQS